LLEPSTFTTSNLLIVDTLSIDIPPTRGLTNPLLLVTPPDPSDLSTASPSRSSCSFSPSSARLPHQLLSINLSTTRTSNLPPQSTKASNLTKLAHAILRLKHLDTSISALGLA
jgi:hypothetical protein